MPKEEASWERLAWACSEELYDCHRQMGSYHLFVRTTKPTICVVGFIYFRLHTICRYNKQYLCIPLHLIYNSIRCSSHLEQL